MRSLRFMLQKDALAQDMYLIGPPGPLRRQICMKYAELTKRSIEYVALSQDTTESDLKQRREITSGTAKYIDCAATRAAIDGSLLILDGVEKAERNVLVILNNLLENREMALEDGRFLVAPKRFDALLQEHTPEELASWKLVRTSDQFRCIALGLPIPRYVGNGLDPPFRSRFQARDIQGPRINDQLKYMVDTANNNEVPQVVLRCLVQAAAVIKEMREADGTSVSAISGIPEFPQGFEDFVAELYSTIPELRLSYVASFLFPHIQLLSGVPDDRLHVVQKVFRRFGLEDPHPEKGYSDGLGEPEDNLKDTISQLKLADSVRVESIRFTGKNPFVCNVAFLVNIAIPVSGDLNQVSEVVERTYEVRQIVCGANHAIADSSRHHMKFVATYSTEEAFARMALIHACGEDMCVIGEKGGGKSRITAYFASRFGYRTEHIPLYKDVSARQLLQRRGTLPNGDTIWEDSTLIRAALLGRIAVLDGIEQMIPGTLATLQELVIDRECRLPDGRRLVSKERFDEICRRERLSAQDLKARNVEIIHPSFRIIALARPSNLSGSSAQQARGAWLLPELQTMFRFVYLNPMPPAEQSKLLVALAPDIASSELDTLNKFARELRSAVKKDDSFAALESVVSLRQTARVCRRLSSEDASGRESRMGVLRRALLSAALDRFLPPLTREAFHGILESCGINDLEEDKTTTLSSAEEDTEEWRIRMLPAETPGAVGTLKVGKHFRMDVFPPRDPLLVPSIVFYDNPRQTAIMAEMLRDWKSGQHLLLIGNQGVGKNKLADRMLQLLQLPREYIQLHRDTTVQNLTSNPTIVEGRLMYDDSPLVRAAKQGHVLVVDEADKAPTYVTSVLKALVEDRSMLLSDGRRVVDESHVCENPEEEAEVIRLHPEFRVIALANRPGFPFHGNDFFREVGDVFACHAIDNPDAESEMHLMRAYGPNVPTDVLRKLVSAFDELRTLSDEGKLNYPYSTREVAAVVKHMERFSTDGIDRILRNVFDFDTYSIDERKVLVEVFAKHGLPFSVGVDSFQVKTSLSHKIQLPQFVENWEHSPGPFDTGLVKKFIENTSLSSLARFNHGTGSMLWNLREPVETGNLRVQDRNGQIFTEERYSFRIPKCSVLNGLVLEKSHRLCIAGRSASLNLYVIDAKHQRYVLFDLFASLPSDGTYRVAPKVATMHEVAPEVVLMCHREQGYFLVVDLNGNTLTFFEKLPGVLPATDLYTSASPLDHNRSGACVAMYHKREHFIGFMDFERQTYILIRSQVLIERVSYLCKDVWIVTEHGSFHEYKLQLDLVQGQYSLERLVKRDAKTGDTVYISPNKVRYLSASFMKVPFGNVKSRVRPVVYEDGSAGVAVNLPIEPRNAQCNLYRVDSDEEPAVQASIHNISSVFLEQSQLHVVAKERSDVHHVDVSVYDYSTFKYRTIQVNLEEDKLTQFSPSTLRNIASQKKPLTSLSPQDLTMFSMVRQAIDSVDQRLFVLEHPDGESIITVDCLGTVRVFYVTELAIRRAFQEWRTTVGQVAAGEESLHIVYATNDDE